MLEQIQTEFEKEYTQKLNELKLITSKVRQENQKCFALIMEKNDQDEHDAEDKLSKLKKEETARLEIIVTDLKEKQVIEKRVKNEQYLSSARFFCVLKNRSLCTVV